MITFFKIILYQPLFNLLVLIYQYVALNDFGVAIILLTLLIRILLYPLFYFSFKNQTLLQKIQPEIQKIQHLHKDSQEKKAQALLELYKRHKVNPFASFFVILIQLPVLISLYQIFFHGFSPEMFKILYPFVAQPTLINYNFLHLIDLQKQNIILVSLSAVLQYLQTKLSMPKRKPGDQRMIANEITLIVGPLITIFIFMKLPAALSLYWLVTTVFSIGQQLIINHKIKHELSFDNTTNTPGAGV